MFKSFIFKFACSLKAKEKFLLFGRLKHINIFLNMYVILLNIVPLCTILANKENIEKNLAKLELMSTYLQNT